MPTTINPVAEWFTSTSVREKIQALESVVSSALELSEPVHPTDVGRDVLVLDPHRHPPKPGIATAAGQARLLHDLASIELQAMELAVRGLCEYTEAPPEFRLELAELALGEGRHLKLCLDAIEKLNFTWGAWPVHLALWNTVSASDTLLDRIMIVHRYLEGSGLDAGYSISRRLIGIGNREVRSVVQTIVNEEVDHVRFGSLWYRKIATQEISGRHSATDRSGDPNSDLGGDLFGDFSRRMQMIMERAPRKEKICRELRLRAGFTEEELNEIERLKCLSEVKDRVAKSSP